jgi:nucleoside triphosphate pyrophosphatase
MRAQQARFTAAGQAAVRLAATPALLYFHAMHVVLGSASPRRRELLGGLGLVLEIAPAGIDEAAVAANQAPAEGTLAVARAKAAAIVRPGSIVLTADTVVVLDGDVLGKPADGDHARRMLRALSGRAHEVITAVVVRAPSGESSAVRHSEVTTRAYGDDEIEAYVASGGGLDKAGAYGIQDEPFRPVAAIAGCWCNVMGLPLWTAAAMLTAAGVHVPRDPARGYARCAACPLRSDAPLMPG